MSDDLDFYDLLGVGRDATEEEIRTAFRDQVREYHPDLNDDPRAGAQFTALKKAYDTLADPKERDAYDRMGHDEYVRTRISGLPSASRWEVPDEDEGEGDGKIFGPTDGATDAGSGDTSPGGNGSSNGTGRGTGPDPSGATGGSSATASSGTGGTGPSGTGPSGDGSSGGSTSSVGDPGAVSGNPAGSGSSPGGFGPGSGTFDDAGGAGSVSVSSTSTRSTATGVGTARGPGTSSSGESGPTEPEREPDTEAADEESSGWSIPPVTAVLRRWLHRLVGWPMILYANATYLVGISLYVAANQSGFEALLRRLQAAGTDPGSVAAVLESRHGIRSMPTYLLSDLSGAGASGVLGVAPAGSILFLAGAACLPTVYFFLVRWTRGGGRAWEPTYLYVLGASAPLVGVVVSATVQPPGLYADLSLFVVVPVLTMATMLYFGRVNPRVKRAIRRWRYRA